MKNQSRKNKAMKELKALLNKLSAIDATRDPLVKRVCQLGKMKILGISIIILIIGYTGISIATTWGIHVPIIYMKIMIPLVVIAFIATLIKGLRTGV